MSRQKLGVVVVGLAVSLLGTPRDARAAVQDGCIQDVFDQFSSGGALNCTASDVKIAEVTAINVLDDGCQFPGDTVTFDARLRLVTTGANFDIGVFIGTLGNSALSGQCFVETLPANQLN